MPMTAPTFEKVVALTRRFPPRERLRLAATIASQHPRLTGQAGRVQTLLATLTASTLVTEELGGGPRHVLDVENLSNAQLRQAQIAGEAVASIWSTPLLESSAAAVALGAKRTNRERVRKYRERSWLLGLPYNKGFLYPRFQFDEAKRDVFPEVRSVNQILGASQDPWGVASWWVSGNDRLRSVPMELVGRGKQQAMTQAAEAVLEPLG